MKYRVLTLFIIVGMNSCRVVPTNYDFTIRDGGYAELSEGKWILNKPFTNAEQSRVEQILYKELKKSKDYSVTTLAELRTKFSIRDQYAFDMTKSELQSLRKITAYDYLLSVKTNASRKNQGGFSRRIGIVQMKVYDLKNGVLVSYVIGTGVASLFDSINDDEAYITFINGENAIMLNALRKLLSKYKKQKI